MSELLPGCFGSTRLHGAGEVPRKDGAYFGPPKPESGLSRSSERKSQSPTRSEGPFQYTDRRKGGVPDKSEKPIMGITTSKNFITANAVEAILQAPKRPPVKELNYMKKEDFGKVPAYLTQVREEVRRENEMIERYVKQQMGQVERTPESFEELTRDEREQLIDELKAKWDSVNAKYQKITHLVKLDTTGQMRRKEQLENELQMLEHDIERLEKAGEVLIRND
ncbi:hypothetical protein EON65_10100 [archaeon]|nr:MAG: hypothetical protein EON65_10100 [archaeon]